MVLLLGCMAKNSHLVVGSDGICKHLPLYINLSYVRVCISLFCSVCQLVYGIVVNLALTTVHVLVWL